MNTTPSVFGPSVFGASRFGPGASLDHLVVVAHTLDQGVAWCEQTLGITPGPGGKHPLFGTHNRLFKIATPSFERAYFEIIAIDHDARDEDRRLGKRWFDMDDKRLQSLVKITPRLVHFVASTTDLDGALQALAKRGIDRGADVRASRETDEGLLEWRISVRDDGQRLYNGALPTLIEWGSVHPADTMPDSGVTLESLQVSHPQSVPLSNALTAIGLADVDVKTARAELVATLRTPKGLVTLTSEGV
jgi:hypothetical protein